MSRGACGRLSAPDVIALVIAACNFRQGRRAHALMAMAKDLFAVVLSWAVKIEINQTYPTMDD